MDIVTLALVGGTVWLSPAAEPIPNAVVLIEGGKIAAAGPAAKVKVPAGARIINCSGLTVTAGFWNSHIHFTERKWADVGAISAAELTRQLTEMLGRHGFTSVFDLGSTGENTRRLRARIEAGEVAGPRIRTTGEGILPPNAAPNDTGLAMMGWMKTPLYEAAEPIGR